MNKKTIIFLLTCLLVLLRFIGTNFITVVYASEESRIEEIHNEELDEFNDEFKLELNGQKLGEEVVDNKNNLVEKNHEDIDFDSAFNFGDPLHHLNEKEIEVPKNFVSEVLNKNTFVERIGGENRLRVAENISQRGWSTSDTVIIANGYQFTDALSGTPLAAHYNAPMLLVDSKGISNETLAEIERLGAEKVIILGGPVSVPEKVVNTLSDRNLDIQRIAGENRYDTSRKIAEELISLRGVSSAHLVNGDAYADAVSISSVAGRYKHPIVLTRSGELHPEARKVTNQVKDWRIIGGTSSVSSNVENQLNSLVNNTARLSGQNRYEVNKRVLNHWGINSDHIYIGSGEAFADILTGSVTASKEGSGVLLTSNFESDIQSSGDYARSKSLERFILLGGNQTLNDSVYNAFDQLYKSIEREHENEIYTVQQGDNFRRIAEGFGLSTLQLEEYNPQVKNINNISTGDQLAVTRTGVENMLDETEKKRLTGTNNPSDFSGTQQFIDWIASRAQKIAIQTGEEALYTSLMIAQAMHESGIVRADGESQLARPPHYNLFGIKANLDNS